MATPTLAKNPSPEIPQDESRPYSGELIDELIDLVEQVEKKPPAPVYGDNSLQKQNERTLLALWYAGDNLAMAYFAGAKVKARAILEQCEYEHPENHWGECDGGFRCRSRATVHDLASEMDLCLAHFRKVT